MKKIILFKIYMPFVLLLIILGCSEPCKTNANDIQALTTVLAKTNPVFFHHGNNNKIDTLFKRQVEQMIKSNCTEMRQDSLYREFIYVFMMNNYYNDLKYGNQSFEVSFDAPLDKIVKDYKKIFGRNIKSREPMFSTDPVIRLNFVSKNTLLLKRKIDSLENLYANNKNL